jgi:hypothetical protein
MASQPPSLTPGAGFRLDPSGQWEVDEIPPEVLDSAEFSGYLTIHGYRASVFEAPGGEQWAQKSVNTPATASSAVSKPRSSRRTQMGPKQTAEHLRLIASKLDKSSAPDKSLVVRDLKFVLANMTNVGEQEQQSMQEQQALPQSGAGKGMLKKMLDDLGAALETGDEAAFKTLLEKLQKNA